MTRKLTDEQVFRIHHLELYSETGDCFTTLFRFLDVGHILNIRKHECPVSKTIHWGVYTTCSKITQPTKMMDFDEAIAYAEHLLNQRYQWLPQQQSWIMSGEVYNFANGGANKVMELMHLVPDCYYYDLEETWYTFEGGEGGYTPSSCQFAKGITIPADSPIWDAVKGLNDEIL
jgi:hypothetical protein